MYREPCNDGHIGATDFPRCHSRDSWQRVSIFSSHGISMNATNRNNPRECRDVNNGENWQPQIVI